MTINRIYIKNFGGINNKEYVLSDGLNVIFGNNEAGKSTFLSFIRFAFFGAKKQRGKELSFREKFMPWNGEDICGEIEFTHNGIRYSLSRSVSASGRKNQASLFNKTTGDQVPISADDIGAELFGMSEQAFLKTMFIASEGTHIDSDGEILSKISNIAQSGDETTSYQFIKKQLDEMIAELCAPRRSKALIPCLENELAQLNKEKAHLESMRGNQELLLKQLEEISQKLDKAITEKTRLTAAKVQTQKYSDYIAYKKCAENLKQAEDDFNKENNSLTESSKNRFDRITNITAEEEQIILESNTDQKATAKMQQLLFKDKASSTKISGIISALITLVSAIGAVFIPLISGISAIALAVCIYCFVSSKKFSKQAEEIENQLLSYEELIKDVLKKYGLESREHYVQLKREFSDSSSKEELIKSKIQLAERIYKQRKAEFDLLCKDLTEKYGNTKIEECSPPEESEAVISEKIKQAEQNILYFTSEKAKLKSQTDTLENCSSLLTETNARIQDLKSKKNQAEENLRILTLATDILDESYEELKENFAPRLAKATAEIFNGLTAGKYGEIIVNDRFEMQIKKDGQFKNSNYFSSGTIQQLYFSLRLGIIELISGNLPLFIDDAFITYDDERFSKAAYFISNYAEHNQIIFSTCHARETHINGAQLLQI